MRGMCDCAFVSLMFHIVNTIVKLLEFFGWHSHERDVHYG